MADTDHGPEAEALRREADEVFQKLRDIAARGGTPQEHQMIGYALGYVEAMVTTGHLVEARDKLDWLKTTLARTGHTTDGVPYVGGPFDGGYNPDGEIDAIDIRRGGGHECGRYVLAEVDGRQVYQWEPEQG
ncbi:hypothetical protein HCJ76_43920 [Streptomyces sp. MC1]|uniref:hypothetical protein n=1 Tax=Streptomyces sp. MC1 TaxID=295105 RepID=UPI0018C920B4|nr:hypothetical protein [Streptomyces sp. MC1]MBG7704831.1 hypothetical protein [Streptomyces sp. MC1]